MNFSLFYFMDNMDSLVIGRIAEKLPVGYYNQRSLNAIVQLVEKDIQEKKARRRQ